MICDKCQSTGIHQVFITFNFWFCPKCRDEIKDSENTTKSMDFDQLVLEFERLVDSEDSVD